MNEVVDDNDTTEVVPEDPNDKFVPPDGDDSGSGNGNNGNTSTVETGTTACSRRMGKPYNYAKKFPALYGDTSHVAGASDTLCLHLYYYNYKLNLKLGAGICYGSSFFTGVDSINSNARANHNTDTNSNVAKNANGNGDAGDDNKNANAKANANMDDNTNANAAINANANGDAVSDTNANAKFMCNANNNKANGDANNAKVNITSADMQITMLILMLLTTMPIWMLMLRLILMGTSAHLHRQICLRSIKMITNYMTLRKKIDKKFKITAKTFLISQRSFLDVQLSIGFHFTCVKCPDDQDWKKITHLEQYIWKTRFLPLIIVITDERTIIYIDEAHEDYTN